MTYSGTMIEELMQSVERVRQALPRTGDPYLDLAEAKIALADKPMDAFDEAKWWKADRLQHEVLEGR